jgi:hypothetical protein
MNRIEIPENLYGTELLCFLYPNNYEKDKEKQAIELLHKICSSNLTDFHNINLIKDLILTEEERNILIQNEWNNSHNIEVKARCNDLLSRFEKQDKRQIIMHTSDYYLVAYKETGDEGFIIRAITARNIKVLNDDIFISNILSELPKIYAKPYQLNMLIIALRKSYPIDKINSIIPTVERCRNEAELKQDFSAERRYIEVLLNLQAYSKDKHFKERALSFEKEADNIIKNKQPNTIYPTIPESYQNAYNEIFKIKNKEPEIFERIKEKLTTEMQNWADILSTHGIKTNMPIPDEFKQQIKKHVKKIRLNTFCDIIKLFLSIPFATQSEIEKYEQ